MSHSALRMLLTVFTIDNNLNPPFCFDVRYFIRVEITKFQDIAFLLTLSHIVICLDGMGTVPSFPLPAIPGDITPSSGRRHRSISLQEHGEDRAWGFTLHLTAFPSRAATLLSIRVISLALLKTCFKEKVL